MRKIQVFIADPQYIRVLAEAQQKGISLSEWIRRILDNHLSGKEEKTDAKKDVPS
jgi:predicted HicB family RNase H-like nuclease